MNKPHEKKTQLPAFTVRELATLLDCPYEGGGETVIKGVASLEKGTEGDLVFLSHRKNLRLLDASRASAAIIPAGETYSRLPVLKAENPHLAFIRAVELFWKPYRPLPGIHPSASVSASAKIGERVSIGAYSCIGDDVEIGAGTVIFPLAVIYPEVKIGKEVVIHSNVSIREGTRIGSRVIIHNGVVIGSDGFGYLQASDGTHLKIPQKGTVVIEDDVEIGANTAIDRAALGETVIGRGTKIDNLVQVAHNVETGENCILAALTGIAGSTKIGRKVIMGGQVGVSDHVKIGDNVLISAKSGIMKDISSGSAVGGIPHMEVREWLKAVASLPHLHELVKEVKKLREKIAEIDKKIPG